MNDFGTLGYSMKEVGFLNLLFSCFFCVFLPVFYPLFLLLFSISFPTFFSYCSFFVYLSSPFFLGHFLSIFLFHFFGGIDRHKIIIVNILCKTNICSKKIKFEWMTCIFHEIDVSKRSNMTHVYMWITLWIWWIRNQKVT